MEAGGDDLFVINDVEADEREEVRDSRPVEQAQETEAEVMESVKGLVPLCAQHAQGPQLSSATFGYDIALMAKRPWAEPGAKLSDYFNYGFNEQSWRVYCAMQEKGEESLLANATAMLQKLELAARPGAGAAAEEAGAGGHVARGEPPMMMVGGIMDGYSDGGPYGGGHGMYGGQEGPGRGGGYGRPYQPREFHPHGGGGFERLQNANYKTRLCKGFAEGHCNRGNQCNFAHGVGELRQPGGGEPIPPPPPPQQQQHMPQQLPPAGLAAGGSAPPPMAQVYGDHRSGFNNYYTPPPPQVMTGGAPPQAPERVNYLMPSFQGGASMPPMMGGPAMPMQDSSDGAGSGFRQPPKRPRQDGGGVYEPQY